MQRLGVGAAASSRSRSASNGTRSKRKRSSSSASPRRDRCAGDLHQGPRSGRRARPARPSGPARPRWVELALLRRLGRVEDRGEIEVRDHGLPQAHGLVRAQSARAWSGAARAAASARSWRPARRPPPRARRPATTRLTRPMRSASVRIDPVAGEEQLVGLLLAEDERHQERDGPRSVADLGLAEARVVGGDDHVAGHRQLAARRPGTSLARPRSSAAAATTAPCPAQTSVESSACQRSAPRFALDLLGDVEAGRERAAGAGQHDHLDLVVGRRAAEAPRAGPRRARRRAR